MRLSSNWITVEAKFSRGTALPRHWRVPQPGWVMVPPRENANNGRPFDVTPLIPRPAPNEPTVPGKVKLLLTKETQFIPNRASLRTDGVNVCVQLTTPFLR